MAKFWRNHRRPSLIAIALVTSGVGLSSCSVRYATPARGISMQSLAKTDVDIRERMTREPSAEFPARTSRARSRSRKHF